MLVIPSRIHGLFFAEAWISAGEPLLSLAQGRCHMRRGGRVTDENQGSKSPGPLFLGTASGSCRRRREIKQIFFTRRLAGNARIDPIPDSRSRPLLPNGGAAEYLAGAAGGLDGLERLRVH